MTKVHTQLKMPIPSLELILQNIKKTSNTYRQNRIKIDAFKDRLRDGDMSSVDNRLYTILTQALQLNIELFAGALNHHPDIPTWYTARKQDTFWGGIYDSMAEKTWANMRAIANPLMILR